MEWVMGGTSIKINKYLPYARHYKPRLVYFLPHFQRPFFVFKEIFSENFVFMYGLYSRAACNQERPMMARVRYLQVLSVLSQK